MQTQSIEARKTFTASVAHVYAAWTEFEQLRNWWKPSFYTLTESQTQVETSGKIDYRFRNEDGEEATLTGSYKEVKPEALLDYEWTWNTEGKANGEGSNQHIQITFAQDGEGCKVEVTQSQDAPLEKEAVQHSWMEAMESLQAYLNDRQAAS